MVEGHGAVGIAFIDGGWKVIYTLVGEEELSVVRLRPEDARTTARLLLLMADEAERVDVEGLGND